MHRLATLLVGMLIFVAVSGIVTAVEIIVEPRDSIQAAVSGASSGDEIIVKPGTYTENIRITTQNLVIRSESGNPGDTVVTAKDLRTNVFSLEQANNTQISGFKIKGAGDKYAGVSLVRCSKCTITNNEITENYDGIYLRSSDNNNLSGNKVNSNRRYGMSLSHSQKNDVSNNAANLNNFGIVLQESSNYNNLLNNRLDSNRNYGIYLANSNNCELTDNTAINNDRGIYFRNSNTNKILDNKVSENNVYGILISLSNYNTISGNTANKTSRGIHLDSSDGNTVSGNTVASNSYSGLFMCAGSNDNRVFNNYLNNTYNADIYNRRNTWNTTRTIGTNIAGGSYIGGNFWATPAGKGFSQIAQDVNGDGIADSEYAGRNFTDYLPLVSTSTPQQSILPVADFSSNVTSGNAPLDVSFADKSTGTPTAWNWDFGDGANSEVQSPVHTYSLAGTYTVKLTVSNPNGTDSKTGAINVLQNSEPVPEPSEPVLPVADFSTSTIPGPAPLAVQFTDLSQNAVSWSWDFDNNGQPDSAIQSPVYVYEVPGDYTVNLSVSNQNGTSSKTATIIVLEAENINDGLPVADFSMNVSEGYAPLSVLYTDVSQKATGIGWDFDNDDLADVSSGTVVYVYPAPGVYTVTLTAANENGTASKTATITVLKESSSGGSSHSSGGSVGGSPEPAKNVETKELSQVFITNGKAVKFDFTKNATCVAYVSFDAKKTLGKTTTIVEELKNKSALVSELPSDEVCKSFNVWVGNGGIATSKNIENPEVCFKVEKAWIQDKKIDQSTIALNRYSNKTWEQLPVNLSGEDEKCLYFTADVPGFSSFAITGKIEPMPGEGATEIEPGQEIGSIEEEGMESTGSEVKKGPEQEENVKAPGFELAIGVACLLSVFLYKRT
ncbi:hypothetical protein EO98_08395 [Methanosarcina sp. 2.H.T.1A.6]|uniref:PGF-pre-PGF domain-containing protein n=1 Tax=unclassified Methanosarcina TaxID=2644672 RepID=UPI00062186AD|nr:MULTISPECIES: PGF-pre-PGF domain-containing protein [unclassified Methanosarcina]KKG11946.1 hypothetical protein EO97_03030 [Methanosarcina sp. 2.H.T.1A.15]KKG16085.1 hypothetical protein EO94_08350 [Methanosarcina sp. 2.H.T.1A.3]KKG20928.1 hypothetical protein EO96_07650 [Methanosarcina sp. 2.H.T.1A.8]KKG24319.1 hypothetical protein EO98_08395 [Methanosarcina sp. 2.H.T.1A.6]